MILLLGVVVIAVAVGYAIGGRLGNLGSIRLQWWWLAPLGLALQLIPVSADRSNPFGYALLVASYVVLVVFAARNLRLAGMVPVLVGLALNGLVVTANHGMPVTRSALRESGQESLLNDLEKHGGADGLGRRRRLRDRRDRRARTRRILLLIRLPLLHPGTRELHRDGGAPALEAVDGEGPAGHLSPFTHHGHAEVALGPGGVRVEPDAVVLDLQPH